MANRNRTHVFHGYTTGGRYHPLYSTWAQMLSRCNSKSARGYKNYGGRGIKVCERWLNFALFLEDMGEKPSPHHTLDRFPNNNGNYEPGNCRWATQSEQQRNKRLNRLLTYNGKTQCITEWAEEIGTTTNVLYTRIKLGWSVEDVLTVPVKKKLTADKITEIKRRLGTATGTEIAREFGVSRSTISMIRTGKIWKN